MPKFFGSIQLVIDAKDEDAAAMVQSRAAEFVVDVDDGSKKPRGIVISATADESVEEDEFGHAG